MASLLNELKSEERHKYLSVNNLNAEKNDYANGTR